MPLSIQGFRVPSVHLSSLPVRHTIWVVRPAFGHENDGFYATKMLDQPMMVMEA